MSVIGYLIAVPSIIIGVLAVVILALLPFVLIGYLIFIAYRSFSPDVEDT